MKRFLTRRVWPWAGSGCGSGLRGWVWVQAPPAAARGPPGPTPAAPRRTTAAHRPQHRADPCRLHLRFMCRQVIKGCNYEQLLPRLAQPRALILTGNARILHPLTAAPSRGAGGDAQGRTDTPCEDSEPRTRLPKPRLRTNGATVIPGTRQDPAGPCGTLSPGRSRRPRGQRRPRCDPRPGGGALPRAARLAGSRSPRPPHGTRRSSPAAPAPALRAPGAHRSLGPEAPPLPGAPPGLPRPPAAPPGAPLGRCLPLPARGAPRGS